MRPLAEFPADARRAVRGVLCDLDDTVTTGGRLTAEAYASIARLDERGIAVVLVTGRPAGWCDHIARMWPVAGVVGENGAFYFRYDAGSRRMKRVFAADRVARARNRERLAAIGRDIVREVPGCALAADQSYRETDLAVDYCEDVPRLPPAAVARIVQAMRAHGLTAKVSSIHVNGWFGNYDKLGMTLRLAGEELQIDPEPARQSLVFVGDSPNDAPMFAYFAHSVGVANVREYSGCLPHQPRYVTLAPAGAGFSELAGHLLAARA